MKYRLFMPLALAVLVLGACTKDKGFETEGNPSMNVSIAFQTKAGGSVDEAKPTVNSIRILVFDADPASPEGTNGKCVFNEYYPFGFTVTKKTGYYQAALTSRIELSSKSKIFNVYAVINEDGYQLTGPVLLATADASFSGTGTDLKALLSEVEAGVLESTFKSICGQPVSYAAAVQTEPAFLMYAYSENVEFEDSGLNSPDPVQLQLIDPDKGRPMAQIFIDKITTDDNPQGAGSFSNDLAKVFVLDVSLENVPNSFQWDAADNVLSGSDKLASIPICQDKKVTDDGTSYYQRVWNGQVTTEVTVNATVKQETHERLYRTKDDGGIQRWNFPDLLGGDGAFRFTLYNSGNSNKQAILQPNYIDYSFLTGNDFLKVDNNPNNCGKLIKVFNADEKLENTFTVTGPTSTQGVKSGSALSYSDDKWTVNLGDTYYVPENIQTSTTNATFLKVTLAVSAPTLDLSSVQDADYPQPYDFSASSYVYGLGNVEDFKTHFSEQGKTKAQKEAMTAEVKQLFQANSHIVWYDDLEHEVTGADGHNSYAVYVSGFYRSGSGSGNSIVSHNQKGAEFKWNVPSTGNVHTFTIPINNNQDGSYSVHRNTRYKITLHVTDSVYGTGLLTKSGSDSGIGISAEVVTEKIDDDE